MYRKTYIAAAFAIWAGMAQADTFIDSIVTNLQDLGYEFIEIQDGIGQVKVEAIRGGEKLELIYDRATGQILKQERDAASAGDIGRTGVQIRTRDRDFLGDDEDDDRSGAGSGSDDDDDDHDNSGPGSSSSGSGSGGDDDDHDDDNSGSGSSSSGSGSGGADGDN